MQTKIHWNIKFFYNCYWDLHLILYLIWICFLTSILLEELINIHTGAVPNHQSFRWSQMAFAADIALDSLRALITAPPLPCTVCKFKVLTILI